MIRVAISRYQAGRPSGAKTKIATIMTMSRKLVPHGDAGAELLGVLGREFITRLVTGDVCLGAVVLEDARRSRILESAQR